jgi:hypothetical protein
VFVTVHGGAFREILQFTDITAITLAFQKYWIYYRESVILHYRDGCGINGGFIYYLDNTVLFWLPVINRSSAFFDVLRYLTYLNKLLK